jgi:hypothetical protein
MGALVVEHMHLLGVEKMPVSTSRMKASSAKVPQAGDDVVELPRALVALGMLHVIVEPKFSAASGLEW